jgi:hypothetical protein
MPNSMSSASREIATLLAQSTGLPREELLAAKGGQSRSIKVMDALAKFLKMDLHTGSS